MLNIRSMILFVAMVLGIAPVVAQQGSEGDREKYKAELRNYKHEFFVRELSLEKEQATAFLELYDQMEDSLEVINEETRQLERAVHSNAEATSVEVDAAISAIYNQKIHEGQIEYGFMEKFRQHLTPRQLLLLKSAERKFNQQLVRFHHRKGKKPAGK